MAKKETKEQKEQNEAYMENYKKLVERLYWLSTFNVRQFMGTREEGDPRDPHGPVRVNYLAGLESFKNLANAQISGIVRVLTMLLGDKKPEFLKIMEEELANQIKAMEEDVGITEWANDGTPRFDLQVLREKTKGWPG